jgi:proprotein convertase subtilisin/kexin type 5
MPTPDASFCIDVGCHRTCGTCVGSGAIECLSCHSKAHLTGQPPHGCACDAQHFGSPDASNCVPESCHPTCGSCDGPGISNCNTCKPNGQLNGDAPNSCKCGNMFYANPDASLCSPCHSTCNTCTGSFASQCTSCRPNAELMGPSPNQCVCRVNFIPSPDSSLCSASNCHTTCSTCQGSGINECLTCK